MLSRVPLRHRGLSVQLLVGVLAMASGVALEVLVWPWIGAHHLLLLLPPVAIGSLLGGGLWAGLSATGFGVLAWLVYFQPLASGGVPMSSSDWMGVVAYVTSGAFVSLLGSKRLLELYARADEFERLEYAVQSAKVGIWEWDVVHDRSLWNDRMFELYGLKPGEFGGDVQAWQRWLHPEDVGPSREALEAALKGEREFDLNFRVVWPDGTVRILHANALVRRDREGRPLAVYGLNRDVTEEERTLASLQELNAFFQAAMDQSQVGIVIVDAPSGAVRFANDAALAIRGGSRTDLVDRVKHFEDYLPWQLTHLDGSPMPSGQMPLVRSFLNGETISQEVGMRNSKGELRIVLTNTAPIRREDGSIRAGIAVFFDNTERYQLLEQLKTAREAAEQASIAKSRFLDIAAHELRTPVTAFSLLLQVTQRRLEQGHAVDASVLVRLRAQVERLSRLVIDLLEVSRLDRGMLILKQEINDLGHLLEECISNFELQFPDRKFSLIGNGHYVAANIDPVRIYEVVSNFIDNAVKYTPKDSPIELVIDKYPDRLRVSVRDRGPGISAERRKSLFQPFERGSSGEEEAHAGLGLGLYICRKIVELHGGSVGVESTAGGGSTFYFEIPRAVVEEKVS